MLGTEPPAIATLTIRNVEPALKEILRVRAARNGRSMEAELREILRDALKADAEPSEDLYSAIRKRVEPVGGFDILEHPDEPVEPPRVD